MVGGILWGGDVLLQGARLEAIGSGSVSRYLPLDRLLDCKGSIYCGTFASLDFTISGCGPVTLRIRSDT